MKLAIIARISLRVNRLDSENHHTFGECSPAFSVNKKA
jgi:hypothetical protein